VEGHNLPTNVGFLLGDLGGYVKVDLVAREVARR
jgi:hypothetical protein